MTGDRRDRSDCPDLEEIAAYLDDRLTQPERAAVECHVVACEPCYDLFAEAAGALAHMPAPEVARPARPFAPPKWFYGAVGVAAAVMMAVWLRPVADPASQLNEHATTVVMAGEERPFDVRLSGEDRWRKPAAATRGDSRLERLPADATIALGEILRSVESGRTAPRLAALGRAQLAAGRVDDGLAALEESLALGDATPALLSDLAAGYIVRARVPERAADLAHALNALDHSLSLDGARLETLFNRAIALERLGLRQEAIAAWDQYLAKDSDSGWADEARERRSNLTQRESRSDAGVARNRLLTAFLPDWAAKVLKGLDPEPGLAEARAMAQAIGTPTDTHASDVVERLASLARDRQAFSRALHAVVAYGEGRRHSAADRPELADTYLAEAEGELRRLGHPLALSATLERALVAFRRMDYEGAHARLEPLLRSAGERNYPSISGRVHWTRGLMWLLEGRARDSRTAYLTAIADLTAAGNAADVAFVTGLLASSYERLGDPVRMWKARVEALQGSSRDGTLLRAAAEARREGWHWAAREFAAAAANNTRKSGRPVLLADVLRSQAIIESELGDKSRAEALLAEARTALSGESGAPFDRVSAEIDLATAMVAVDAGDAAPAIEAASRALEYFSSGVVPTNDRLPEILLTRARLARRIGATERARSDLAHGLAIYGRMREFASPGVDQATLADVARRLTDELVALIAPTDEAGAFKEVERVRAWDLARETDDEAITLPAARDAVPEGTLVVSYVVGDSVTRLWTIRRGRSRLTTIPAGRKHLHELVTAFRSSSGEAAGHELARLLVDPLAADLRPGDTLAIVPDGPLHQLAFAALRARTSRYLVEDHAVLVGPSVSSLFRRGDGEGGRALLAIGNPAFAQEEWPGLADLPGAAREAKLLAQQRPGAIHLHGADATRQALLQHMRHADVVHFAGHAVVNEFTAAESALVLAGRDRLTAGEIRGLSLGHVGLVVLASCDSARGFQPRSDGPMGLARAFQAAGVRYVLAALRPVDDARAQAFFTAFHASLAKGSEPGTALRVAQLQAIKNDPSAAAALHWSSYVLTGPLAAPQRTFTQP